MLSALNCQLSSIETRIAHHTTLLAKLELIALHRKSKKPESARRQPPPPTPLPTAVTAFTSEDQQLERLQSRILKLRARVTHTLRHVDRLRIHADRRDVQLAEIRSRLVDSFGGCAFVRPLSRWTAESSLADGNLRTLQTTGTPGYSQRCSSASGRAGGSDHSRSSTFQPARRCATTPTDAAMLRNSS